MAAPAQAGGENVVAFTKYVGPDLENLVDDPLDGKAAALDAWIDVLEQKARARRVRSPEQAGSRRT